MKKLAVVTTVSVVALALAGCTNAETDSSASAEVTEEVDYASSIIDVNLNASESVIAVNSPGMMGESVTPTGASAVISISGDLSNIDYSNAVLKLTDGDGYYANEFGDPEIQLDETAWNNGSYTLNFDDETIATLFTRETVTVDDTTGGPGWTQFGGNGNGQYFFNLAVSGLKNGDEEIPEQTFRVCYYVYNRDGSDKARVTLADYINVYDYETDESLVEEKSLSDWGLSVTADKTPVWTWIDDETAGKSTTINGTVPVLCDTEQDDFYLTWPEGVDASNLSASDVTIKLTGAYGDELVLNADSDYYVYSSESETQIALPYVYMAFTPVYNSMTISVDSAAIDGDVDETDLSQTYEVASVYVYELQHGGLAEEGAVLCYQFYGFDESTVNSTSQLMNSFEYVLMRYDDNGDKLYYSESDEVSDYNKADRYQADEELFGTKFWNQSILYNTKVDEILEDGTKVYGTTVVDGREYYKVIPNGADDDFGWDGMDLRGVLKTATEAYENGLRPAAGYAFANTDDFAERFAKYNYGHDYWVAHSMWPWVEGVEVGWMNDPAEYKGGFQDITSEEYGAYTYEGDGEYPDWTAPEASDAAENEWWPWLREKGAHSDLFEALDKYIDANY